MKEIWWFFYKEWKHAYRMILLLIGIATVLGMFVALDESEDAIGDFQKKFVRIHLFRQGQQRPLETLEGIEIQLYLSTKVYWNVEKYWEESKELSKLQRQIKPKDWSVEWDDRRVECILDGKTLLKKANRVKVEVFSGAMYKAEVFVDHNLTWKSDERDFFLLKGEQILQLYKYSPDILFPLSTLVLDFLGFFTIFFWIGNGLVSLHALSQALNDERASRTITFYKSLPLSDVKYSVAGYLFGTGFYVLCAIGISAGLGLISSLSLLSVPTIGLKQGFLTIWHIIEKAFSVLHTSFQPEGISVSLFLMYIILTGGFFLMGSLFRQRAFVYSCFLFIGGSIALGNILDNSLPIQHFLKQIILTSEYVLWVIGIFWNILCFLIAARLYALKEL